MASGELSEAMRLGGRGPQVSRPEIDLGRFGLGLKTASFSQCRALTVASRRDGQTSARRWDLDHIAEGGEWHLLIGPSPDSEDLLVPLESMANGTIIVWEKLDRFSGNSDPASELSQSAFLEIIDEVERHLAMVFHRFIGTAGRLRIFINRTDDSARVKPWDPFLSDHPATLRRPIERLTTPAGTVEVQGFVLPHKDHLSAGEYQHAGGPDGWTAQQGFYVYRNQRLLVAGSWLGLRSGKSWTKEEAHKLARLRLDIPNTADWDWKIDIKKSIATPPHYLRARLRLLAEDARQLARDVFAHRGRYGSKDSPPDLARIWLAVPNKTSVNYRIDRKHPAVQELLARAGSLEHSVEALFRMIEQTVPVQRIWLDATEKGEIEEPAYADETDVTGVLNVVYHDLRVRVGLSAAQARAQLLRTEPFQHYPQLVAQLAECD